MNKVYRLGMFLACITIGALFLKAADPNDSHAAHPSQKQDVPSQGTATSPEGQSSILKKIKDKASAPGTKVKAIDLLGNFLGFIPIPDVGVSIFNEHLGLQDITFFKIKDETLKAGLGLKATTVINNSAVPISIYVGFDKKDKFQCAILVSMPADWKISDMLGQNDIVKKLNALSLPESTLAISTFSFSTEEEMPISPGFSFTAKINMTGPLAIIKKIEDYAGKVPGLIAEQDRPVYLSGVISKNIMETKFSCDIPIQIGVDFTKIHAVPKQFSNIIQSIKSGDLTFFITPPPKLSYSLETGIVLTIANQVINLRMGGVVDPTNVGLYAKLADSNGSNGGKGNDKIDFKWFQIGDVWIELDFDAAILPEMLAIGVPFTGIGIGGAIDLGKVDGKQASYKVGGGLKLKSGSETEFLLSVDATNFKFAHLVNLLGKIAHKNIDSKFIPKIEITKSSGYIQPGPGDATFAQTVYPAGISLDNVIKLFGISGGSTLRIDPSSLDVVGSLYLEPFKLEVGGKTLIAINGGGKSEEIKQQQKAIQMIHKSLEGEGEEGEEYQETDTSSTEDDRLTGNIELSALKPQNMKVAIKGKVSIPELKTESQVDLTISIGGIKGTATTKLAGVYESEVDMDFDPTKPLDAKIAFMMKQSFIDLIIKEVLEKINLKKVDIEHQIRIAQDALGSAKKSAVGAVADQVSSMQKERDKYQKQCGMNIDQAAAMCPIGQLKEVIDKAVREINKEIGAPVGVASVMVSKWLGTGGAKIVNAAQQVGNGIVNAAQTAADAVASVAKDTANKAKKAFEDAGSKVEDVGKSIGHAFGF